MPVTANAVDFKNVAVPAVWLNVGMALKLPNVPSVKDPLVRVKALLQVIVPLLCTKVGPFNVNVVHERLEPFNVNVPPVYVTVEVAVKAKPSVFNVVFVI